MSNRLRWSWAALGLLWCAALVVLAQVSSASLDRDASDRFGESVVSLLCAGLMAVSVLALLASPRLALPAVVLAVLVPCGRVLLIATSGNPAQGWMWLVVPSLLEAALLAATIAGTRRPSLR
jgi:hypothetical protein